MTRRYSLFQMWESYRQSLITSHQFYVNQARQRLLSQFDDIGTEADRASDEWLENNSHRFNPDWHDEGDFYESAVDAGIEFYQLLSDMRDRTRLSVVAGMYHEWDKQLRQWMVEQMRGWCSGDKFEMAVWKSTLTDIADLVEPIGWEIRTKDYYSQLDACRLVVNVYKHGNGNSLAQLKRKHPQYLHDPAADLLGESCFDILNYEHLAVSDDQLQAFSAAIEAFWRDIPADIYDHEDAVIPAWLGKALDDVDLGARRR
ncbi:MAG: hypothetical protein CL539_05310 [Alcanivorax sp.]|uniref:hypothetical protein n=1 Tax=Alcanivorax sp. TaxID=1872427 RepID=UPI000C8DACDD|nr:hypothetical protein [Alcanivorax sp.]MAC14084.1 hypothetical protein [Alcanivorax sp.]